MSETPSTPIEPTPPAPPTLADAPIAEAPIAESPVEAVEAVSEAGVDAPGVTASSVSSPEVAPNTDVPDVVPAAPAAPDAPAAVTEATAATAAATAADSAPAAVPLPSPPAPSAVAPTSHAAHGRTGPKGKTRSPIGGWLLLIPTFGLYYLFWYHNINREVRDYDPSISVRPLLAVISLFIPIVGLVSIFNTGNRIRQAQATAGAAPEASGLLGLILSFFVALVLPYYSSQLNKVWQHG
jgi:uncharacterized membrane protein